MCARVLRDGNTEMKMEGARQIDSGEWERWFQAQQPHMKEPSEEREKRGLCREL